MIQVLFVCLGNICHDITKKGPDVFKRITKELKTIMKEKDYKTIEDFRGKLKYL